jgi:hypothetical protein
VEPYYPVADAKRSFNTGNGAAAGDGEAQPFVSMFPLAVARAMAASQAGAVSGRRTNIIFDAAVGAMLLEPTTPLRVRSAPGRTARSA